MGLCFLRNRSFISAVLFARMSQPTPPVQRQFPCKQCGAMLTFRPGTSTLRCTHCGTANEIIQADITIQERQFDAYLEKLSRTADTVETLTVKCNACGAESTLQTGQTSGGCPFCGQPIVAQAKSTRIIKPESLLPFATTLPQAIELHRQWLAGLWFAPNALKSHAERGGLKGVYSPAWTFDTLATTQYTGKRGTHYWVTESYSTTDAQGRRVTGTRQVQRTRWTPASGTVQNTFDDLLVLASDSLPTGIRDALEPWDLKNLVPFTEEYLSGFVSEAYHTDLVQGFQIAKVLMLPTIGKTIAQDIGGDEQHVDSTATEYDNVTFKHVLLPMWISAYRFRDKTYRFLVNARTGEVQGERPWSYVKITFAVILGVVMALIILMVIGALQQ